MSALSLKDVNVLIVEDNFVVADALRFMISGYEASVAAIVPTVERAYAVLAVVRVDIAVLDINLNGVSVVPFADHLRAQNIPFVFLTGYGDEELLPQHLRVHPRFDKPVDAENLVRTLADLVAANPRTG